MAFNSTQKSAGISTYVKVGSDTLAIDLLLTPSKEIISIVKNGSCIYIVGENKGTIRKFNLSDLSYLGIESPPYGGIIRAATVYQDRIYIGGHDANKIRSHKVSDLSFLGEATCNGDIFALLVHNDCLYAGGSGGVTRRYGLPDLQFIDESPNYGAPIYALSIRDSHIYVGGDGPTQRVRCYDLEDFSFIRESDNYGGDIRDIVVTNDYVYLCGSIGRVWRLNRSDLSLVDQSPYLGGDLYCLQIQGDYIYASGQAEVVFRLQLADLKKVDQSPSYGGMITKHIVKDDICYVGGFYTNEEGDICMVRRFDLGDFE